MTLRTHRPDGRLERNINTARQDTIAAELRATGMSYRAIAEQLNVGVATAHAAVTRAIAAVPVDAVEHLRAVELDRLDRLTKRAFEVLAADHPYVSQGRVFRDLQDASPVLTAIRELRALSESRRKLLGLDAPARQTVTVVTEDATEAAIRELEARLADHDTAAAG